MCSCRKIRTCDTATTINLNFSIGYCMNINIMLLYITTQHNIPSLYKTPITTQNTPVSTQHTSLYTTYRHYITRQSLHNIPSLYNTTVITQHASHYTTQQTSQYKTQQTTHYKNTPVTAQHTRYYKTHRSRHNTPVTTQHTSGHNASVKHVYIFNNFNFICT